MPTLLATPYLMAISLSSLACPKSQLWLAKGDANAKWASLENKIKDHPFNYAVEIFIPHQETLPEPISSISLPHYYHTECLPLSCFLQPSFLQNFSSSGELSAIAVGRRIDVHDMFALLPSGTLILSVDKDTYEELGLQGKRSIYQQHRYMVQLDLKAQFFMPGKSCYERACTCLKNSPHLQADFIFSWNPCGTLSQFVADFQASQQDCHLEQEIVKDFQLPLVTSEHPHGLHDDNGTELCCSAQDLHTWLGGVACGLDVYEEGAPDDYVSTFSLPECSVPCEGGVRARWSGMLPACFIQEVASLLKKHLEEQTDLPWAALTVWGFEDAPVSWKSNEHGWLCSGDNGYTLVLFRSGHYWLLTSLASHDVP